ncbi:hypothetical protein B0A49_06527, partial [Cryomyces minteri]
MKFSHILPLAALGAAFVIPEEQVLSEVAIEDHHGAANSLLDRLPSKDQVIDTIKNTYDEVTRSSKNAFDEAVEYAAEAGNDFTSKLQDTAFDAESWIDSSLTSWDDLDILGGGDKHPPHHDHPPHHGPPHHGPPHHGGPHHGHKPNMTVYQLISESKYTTKLAKLINDDEDLVKLLNGTAANYTVFAPTDRAFEKIPEHAPEPSKEMIKKLLSYHVSPDFYPAGRVLATHTIPTLLKVDSLGKEPLPQRLSINLGLRGLTVNFYSRIVAINIFGTNGVIHGVDSLILPPPNVIKIIDLLPGEFSTLELGLGKTGLLEKLNSTDHAGGTFFAPSNFAFRKLGPKINAFLFSSYGQKYLKALLEYHVVPDNTLYSDAFYKAESIKDSTNNVPKGYFHVDLPTLLEDRSLS